MIVLDDSIPYEELLMVWEGDERPATPPLPEGYGWCDDPLAMKDQWVTLLLTLGFPYSEEEAHGKWRSMVASAAPGGLLLAVDHEGDLAATCALCTASQLDPGDLRFHWVMTSPDHQGNGLARILCQRAIDLFCDLDAPGRLLLSTQAQSWAAIALYLSLGFRPWEDGWEGQGAVEARAAWGRAREHLGARGIVVP